MASSADNLVRTPHPRDRGPSDRKGTAANRWISLSTIRRAAWLGVASAHVPGLTGAWATWVEAGFDPARLGGCVALTLAMVFFVLKVVDLPCVRIRADRRAWVAIVLVLGLIHVNALRPEQMSAAIPEYSAVIATTFLVAGFTFIRRLAREVLRRAGSSRCAATYPPSNETVWFDAFRPHCWVLASRLFALRAPPA